MTSHADLPLSERTAEAHVFRRGDGWVWAGRNPWGGFGGCSVPHPKRWIVDAARRFVGEHGRVTVEGE